MKCVMPAWTVSLVIICAAGHWLGKNRSIVVDGVRVFLLSKASVEAFLGKDALKSIQIAKSLLEDTMSRLVVSTQVKLRSSAASNAAEVKED